MRRMTRGLVAAMENEDLNNTPEATDENAVEVAEAGAELSDEVVEIVDAVAEGDADTAEVEEATEVAEALESIAEAVGVAAQNGGLNQDAARAIGIAVGHMYARVGLEAQAMPALESFGSSSQRISSTSLAMEDIKEQAGKIWAAIVAAVQKAIKWAQDFYNKIFGAAEKLAKRADALQNKAEAVGSQKQKEASFENEKLVNALHVDGKVGKIGAELGKLEGIGKHVFGEANTWAIELGTEMVKEMEAEGAEKSFLANFELPAGGVTGKAVSNPEAAGFGQPAEGLQLMRTDEMLGGMAIVGAAATSAMKGEAAVEAFRGVGQKVQPFDPKAKAPADKKVATLASRDMVDICKKVIDLAEVLKKYRDGQSKLNEVKKKFSTAAEKLSKKASGEQGEARDGLRAMAKVAGKFPSLVDQPAASFSAYLINTCKAALDYVEASAKQYGAA